MVKQLGLIGCGLMGGSFALALKKAGLVQRIVGFSASATTTARALELGVIDAIATSAADAAQGADVVLLAVPVAATETTLRSMAPHITAEQLVMDVGSTKSDVVAAARAALNAEQLASFVPAHPITGKEVSGVAHADAQLYQGAKVVLTPLADNPAAHIDRAQHIWQAVGGVVSRMSPEAHDAAFATVSHLPHLLAFAMVRSVMQQPNGEDVLRMAGPGFRDFTRIAASEPRMWRDILIANHAEVLAQAQAFRAALDDFEALMQSGEGAALEAMIRSASQRRAQCDFVAPPPAATHTPTTA